MKSPFVYTRRVPYYLTDTSGVIHHSHFLKFFEEARTEMLREAGVPYSTIEKSGVFLVVTEASCKYMGNTSYDDVIKVLVTVRSIDAASLTIVYEVYAKEKLIAEGYTKLASVNSDRKVIRLPLGVKEALAGLS